MTTPSIAYDKKELNSIVKVLRQMDDRAQAEMKIAVGEIANDELSAIRQAAAARPNKVAKRIADGGSVKKSSLLGEIRFGLASQKLSGGATTQFSTKGDKPKVGIGGGVEFGSNKFKQFPVWSGKSPSGIGAKGWFIYPTIRKMLPDVINRFEKAVLKVRGEWE
jgi:hypothetical protein